jgi:biopolymer transport protein ExbD
MVEYKLNVDEYILLFNEYFYDGTNKCFDTKNIEIEKLDKKKIIIDIDEEKKYLISEIFNNNISLFDYKNEINRTSNKNETTILIRNNDKKYDNDILYNYIL